VGVRGHGQPLTPAEQHNTLIVVDGSKEEYIAKLRAAREAVQSASRDGALVAGAESSRGNTGNVSA
jgi:hypothetical protein